jgi:hypothetical protein
MSRSVTDAVAVEFPSPEWFTELAGALAQIEVPEGQSLLLGQVVTDVPAAPGGEVRYTISFAPGRPVTLTVGSAEPADVVLVTSYTAAMATAAGETSSASMLATGQVKIRGDARRLVEADDLLAAVRRSLSQPPGATRLSC